MDVPSGRKFDADDQNLLKLMARVKFIRYSEEPFRLKSGIDSFVYVVGREDLTDHPDVEFEVGKKIASIVWQNARNEKKPILIGIPTAGNALAQAGAMASHLCTSPQGPLIGHRIMRELRKQHGAHSTWINGAPNLNDHEYWMIDNVATDGRTKLEAADKLEVDGYPAREMPCLIWIDRQQGAVAKLEAEGFNRIIVAYNLLDITYAYGELNLWPKSVVAAVEDEIRAHQFAV